MSDSSQWETALPLLLGEQLLDCEETTATTKTKTMTTMTKRKTPTMATKVDLVDLPKDTSLSTFLSPAGGGTYFDEVDLTLTNNNKQLDSVHLILMALNEECYKIGRGAFYHLPLRSDEPEAHPCDVVYLPDPWSKHDTLSWNEATWVQRLDMCKIEGRIQVDEDVLPICVRMLHFDTASNDSYDSPYGTCSAGSSSPAHSTTESSASTMSQKDEARTPTSQYDPAIKPKSYSYSRPMEDISTLLIIYASHHATPAVCSTAAFEHDSFCTRTATPGDFSETFDYNEREKTRILPSSGKGDGASTAQQKVAAMAAKRVMSSGMASNRDLVEHVWDLWHDEFNEKGSLEKDWLGKVKYSWQEVKSVIDGGGIGAQELPYGWPVDE